MRILVTGGTGFIGSAFLQSAQAVGHEVACIGRRQPRHAQRYFPVEFETGAGLENVPWTEFDALVHLAAAGVKATRRLWPECVMMNIVGTQRLLTAVMASGSRPIVWLAQTFYEQEAIRLAQLMENPYIATKRAASELAKDWARRFGESVVFGTLFQTYGPGDDSRSVLSYAADRLSHCELASFGSGTGKRDWVYVDDVAAGILACLAAANHGVQTFDLGTGQTTSIRLVVERLADIAQVPRSLLIFEPIRDREDLSLDTPATKPPPNWAPRISLDEGLRRVLFVPSPESTPVRTPTLRI